MRRILQIAILDLALIIILASLSASQATRTLMGNVLGPARCTVLENQPVNYFPYVPASGARALFIDNLLGDIYFPIPVSNGDPSIIKCTNMGCGGWEGPQSVIYTGRPTVITTNPNSFAEDINQPTHFFEIWVGGATLTVFRTAKDGSSRIVIYTQVVGINGNEEIAFDSFNDRVVFFHPGPLGPLTRMNRTGGLIESWEPGVTWFKDAVGVFDDGRIVLGDCSNRSLRLFGAWGGGQISSVNTPTYIGCSFRYISVDNENNQVHFFAEPAQHGVWDIASNTFSTRNWVGGVTEFQGAYYKGYVYAKASQNDMLRYNWTTGVEEAWDGSQWVH